MLLLEDRKCWSFLLETLWWNWPVSSPKSYLCAQQLNEIVYIQIQYLSLKHTHTQTHACIHLYTLFSHTHAITHTHCTTMDSHKHTHRHTNTHTWGALDLNLNRNDAVAGRTDKVGLLLWKFCGEIDLLASFKSKILPMCPTAKWNWALETIL